MLLFELLNIDYKDFYRYIDEGWISEREHPEDPNLRIYNYTSPRRLWALAAYNDIKDCRENATHEEICKALRLNPAEEYPAPDDVISVLPDGLRQEFEKQISWFYRQINIIVSDVRDFVRDNKDLPRKEFAFKAREELERDTNIAFLFLDGKDYMPAAWLNVRP